MCVRDGGRACVGPRGSEFVCSAFRVFIVFICVSIIVPGDALGVACVLYVSFVGGERLHVRVYFSLILCVLVPFGCVGVGSCVQAVALWVHRCGVWVFMPVW